MLSMSKEHDKVESQDKREVYHCKWSGFMQKRVCQGGKPGKGTEIALQAAPVPLHLCPLEGLQSAAQGGFSGCSISDSLRSLHPSAHLPPAQVQLGCPVSRWGGGSL